MNENEKEVITPETEEGAVPAEVEIESKDITEEKTEKEEIFLSLDEIDTSIEQVKEHNQQFQQYYKTQRRNNFILLGIFVVIMIAAIFLLSGNPNLLMYMFLGVIVFFVGMMVYTKKLKATLNQKVEAFVLQYRMHVSSYALRSVTGVQDLSFNLMKETDKAMLESLHLVKPLVHVASNAYIQGSYFQKTFHMGDVLLQVGKETDKKVKDLAFLGKMFFYAIELPLKGRILVYLKGKSAVGPNDIEDCHVVEGVLSDRFIVYASQEDDKFLTKAIKESIEKLVVDETLIDAFVLFEANRVVVGLSYNDNIMSIPLLNPIDEAGIEHFKQDATHVFAIFQSATKKPKATKNA